MFVEMHTLECYFRDSLEQLLVQNSFQAKEVVEGPDRNEDWLPIGGEVLTCED